MVAFIDFVGTPTGAEVFVNDVGIGKIPIYNHILKWGMYNIRAEKEGYETEYREDVRVYKTAHYKKIIFDLQEIGAEKGVL